MRILIAAGGTGGHIYPALAVARSLRDRAAEVDIRWVGGRRGLERQIVAAQGYPLDLLWLRSLRTVDLSVHAVLDPLRLLASVAQALVLLIRLRPAAVFTTGGYLAIPLLIAAAVLRVPVLLWEGNLVPGRSVRATARLADALAVSFEETCRRLPGRCYVTGTPIRAFPATDPAAARRALGLPPELPCVLVFGGSQAVQRLNDAVAGALRDLVERATVIHVCGAGGLDEAEHQRSGLPDVLRARYVPRAFLGDEMASALIAADLIVGRAGSSTLAEATALGRPIVVVPYPYAGGHQQANAERLAEAGAARIVADSEFDAQALLAAAELLHDRTALATMSTAASAAGRPGAAAAVAQLVLALARRTSLPAPSEIDQLSRAQA